MAMMKPLLLLATVLIGTTWWKNGTVQARSNSIVQHIKNKINSKDKLNALFPPIIHQRGGNNKVSSSSIVPNKPSLTVWKRFIAGGMSRCLAQMALYPMDALRTLAQTRDGRTLADIGGIPGLIRGCITTSSFAWGMGAIQFSVFGYARHGLHMPVLVASVLGAASSCLVSVPQEVLKQRLVTGIYKSFPEAVADIYRTRSFYSAWRPTMARNVPFVMSAFIAMDLMKRYYLGRQQKQQTSSTKSPPALILSWKENLAIGMGAAVMATLLTQPIDVIKTRMMTQAASKAVPYASAWDCFSTIVKDEGLGTLYSSGLKPRILYMSGLWGLTFALNGKLEQIFSAKEKR